MESFSLNKDSIKLIGLSIRDKANKKRFECRQNTQSRKWIWGWARTGAVWPAQTRGGIACSLQRSIERKQHHDSLRSRKAVLSSPGRVCASHVVSSPQTDLQRSHGFTRPSPCHRASSTCSGIPSRRAGWNSRLIVWRSKTQVRSVKFNSLAKQWGRDKITAKTNK